MFHRLQNINNWAVFYILVLITLSSSVGSAFLNFEGADNLWWSGWLQNFSTEMMGAIATFILFEILVAARDRQIAYEKEIEQRKKDLIFQLRHSDRNTVKDAIRELQRNGWWFDGTLDGLTLRGNFSGMDLRQLRIRNGNLESTNLRNCNLFKADLTSANLGGANLQGAVLHNAKLDGVEWKSEEFITNQHGLKFARFAKNATQAEKDRILAVMPDGTRWTPNTDLTEYTAGRFIAVHEWSRQD